MYIYIYIYIHIHIFIYTYIYVCDIYIYIYIHTYCLTMYVYTLGSQPTPFTTFQLHSTAQVGDEIRPRSPAGNVDDVTLAQLVNEANW